MKDFFIGIFVCLIVMPIIIVCAIFGIRGGGENIYLDDDDFE